MTTEAHFHLIQSGDSPNQDVMRCEAHGCPFRVKSPDRNTRLAASYRHLADVLDYQKEQDGISAP